MAFSLEHDIKVTKNHQNLLPTQSVLTVIITTIAYVCTPAKLPCRRVVEGFIFVS
jgi:hypothetical protein